MNKSKIATHQTKVILLARKKKKRVESNSPFYFSANQELVQWLCSDLVSFHQGLLASKSFWRGEGLGDENRILV